VFLSPVLILACAAAVAAVKVKQEHDLEGLRSAASPAPASVLCGPRSLWTATRRLGIPLEFHDLADVPADPERGTSLGDLKQRAARIGGLEARTCRLSWAELRRHRGTAILFIRDNHFVAADPREQAEASETPAERLRVYDPELAARWWTRGELEAVWQGAALILTPVAAAKRSGPCLEWDTCWLDTGFVHHTEVARGTFRFRNAGTEPLTVQLGHTSCGCANAKISAQTLAPGEEGFLQASVELFAKRGPFMESAAVKTNDPAAAETSVVLAGGVYNDGLGSTDKIYFGEMPQGRTALRRFFVQDPGEATLEVTEARVELTAPASAVAKPPCTVSFSRVEHDSPLVGSAARFPVRPGDYAVEVELQVPEDYPPGKVAGTIAVTTNLPGKMAHLQVGLEALVIPDVEVSPRALLLAADEEKARSGKITLKSLSGKPLAVESVSVKGDLPLQLAPVQRLRPDAVVVAISCGSAAFKGHVGECRVVCALHGGRVVEVPVLVVRKPPQK
jgi:hypothetical protein